MTSSPVVVVSGGASGIGAATIEALRADGYRTVSVDLEPAPHADASYLCDVADVAAVESTIARVLADVGRIDAAVASAGIAPVGTVLETTVADWDRAFAVNVRGVFALARATIPALREAGGGAFVAVASQLGLVGAGGVAAYCATKGAVINLTRALAIDHAADGVRVNCVCPGPTETPLVDRFFAASDDPVALRAAYAATCLHNRLLEPSEVAAAIAFLVSKQASSVLGTALVVDGGYVAR